MGELSLFRPYNPPCAFRGKPGIRCESWPCLQSSQEDSKQIRRHPSERYEGPQANPKIPPRAAWRTPGKSNDPLQSTVKDSRLTPRHTSEHREGLWVYPLKASFGEVGIPPKFAWRLRRHREDLAHIFGPKNRPSGGFSPDSPNPCETGCLGLS